MDPLMPRTRRYLAIPFVGKDCPSRVNEFSHPDIAIGLSTLAYRYEGMRASDVKRVLQTLKDHLRDEFGSYEKCAHTHMHISPAHTYAHIIRTHTCTYHPQTHICTPA